MIDQNRVADNFSKSAEVYEESAFFQRLAASLLTERMTAAVPASGVKTILELGCGTGFLSTLLLTQFSEAELVVSDISPAMLQICREKLNCEFPNRKISYVQADVTESIPGGHFDLVASGLTFQWMPDLHATLTKLTDRLAPKGTIFFSTLLAHTFVELRQAFAECGAPFSGPSLLTVPEIQEIVGRLDGTVETEIHYEQYRNAVEFLRHLRQTGAVNATGQTVPTHTMRQIISNLNRQGNGVRATYELAICQIPASVISYRCPAGR